MLSRSAKRFFPRSTQVAARRSVSFEPFRDGSKAPFQGVNTRFTKQLNIVPGNADEGLPTFRVMDETAEYLESGYQPPAELDQETCVKMYKQMVQLSVMDTILYDAQRQGRISFYMTSTGEEACQIGSAAALTLSDILYAQYREPGVLAWRGFSIQEFTDQCFSNVDDIGKGRQMPVHYGSKKLNYHTISSPLATQLPQAAGAGYALKFDNKSRERSEQGICVCYFGDGSASEGDFHAALNFAATLECPTMFFVRNNGFAISTPVHDQYAGDGIASRALGYGMESVRVDGNDVFAMYECTKAAREHILDTNKPVLIEAMTYRGGHHSTSDDSTRYREVQDMEFWLEKQNPIHRFRTWLEKQGYWSEEQDTELQQSLRKEILSSFSISEDKPKPPISELFTDVFDEMTPELHRQERELHEHLEKYPNSYKLEEYAKSY